MYEAEIARGAAWLDENKPGWERLIDPSMLEMKEPCRCILGQVFEQEACELSDGNIRWDGYSLALHQVYGLTFMPSSWAIGHGFNIDDPDPSDEKGDYAELVMKAFRQLETEWIAFVKDRFNRGALSG